MNHKRRRPKSRRAGCLMCKHWKVAGSKLDDQLKPSELRALQPDEARPTKRHKGSRRKWCKGKEGVPHQTVCMTHEQAKGPLRHPSQALDRYLICKVCGKELQRCHGEPFPDWVTC